MCFVTYYGTHKMMKGLANPVTGVLLLLWLHCVLVSCQVDYSYNPTSPNGPAQWGSLNPPTWVQCSTGTQQSPIDITSPITKLTHPLGFIYRSARVDAEIYNNGHTVTVEIKNPKPAATLTISGVTYDLEDFHFHLPSEHLISNDRYVIELHLVHRSSSGQVAVVAYLYNLGLESTFLSQFFDDLPSYTTPNVRRPINIRLPILTPAHPYYRYNGSLTTPPCSENVVWTVIRFHPTLSQHQFDQLRAALLEENARPIQPRNDRPIYEFP